MSRFGARAGRPEALVFTDIEFCWAGLGCDSVLDGLGELWVQFHARAGRPEASVFTDIELCWAGLGCHSVWAGFGWLEGTFGCSSKPGPEDRKHWLLQTSSSAGLSWDVIRFGLGLDGLGEPGSICFESPGFSLLWSSLPQPRRCPFWHIGFTDAQNHHQTNHHQTHASPNKIYNFKLPIDPPLRAPMLSSTPQPHGSRRYNSGRLLG